jgi:S-adenosylmethionine:tRNA ribosyltransferase-isomerase
VTDARNALLSELAISKWRVLEATKKPINVGQIIEFDRQSRATILKRDATGTTAKVESPIPVTQLLRESGQMPLPPYIKRQPSREDHGWYQTCFAKHEGAIAAPTAGLHFTADLLSRLAERSIQVATITLHVGPGTFKPVVTERIEDHQMGAETFEVGPKLTSQQSLRSNAQCSHIASRTADAFLGSQPSTVTVIS